VIVVTDPRQNLAVPFQNVLLVMGLERYFYFILPKICHVFSDKESRSKAAD
jgi:hypothetical protein